ncbi:TonB-dependent siderophore receptor [Pseudomonas granadensis]|uniref:TonB-dependent receptor n=1 Tax=Pseudomonas TaxID=286 RepID=UPI0019D30536|nr:TonB-dependent siderophore receptor [Pseudomonas granadensis]MBN6774582.1 TonB-dependent siderophore receptor [Pseudomonas granadensis]MBN6805618.1 TonB-dependent siderophore receptor [Pseudomonas granadensis]MBN6832608.1 TonB-dependent siderophore receptor [Pseudomonas granadensis]MBN6839812.1 TonB-dependent siderophore receptor [Pseudomonas granadensis]MBN6869187.1 TonB-dependent siderophore receptor [Pseudomonas granadensis]
MARQHAQLPVSSPRLLASAIGVAITAGSAGQMVFAAEKTESKASGNAIALDATAITGEAQDSTSYQVEKASSPKYTAPLVDTPRSVTVIPQQVLKDTGALNMQDALRTVPGITFGAGEGGNPQGDRPFIRGFDAQGDTYLDGVRDTGSQSREIFAVENIEVSKGPNSAIGGRGAAGGSINLVSKKAHLGNSFDGGFTYGSDQTQRYTLDGNYQFSDSAAGRLNLMSHESNVAGRDKVDYDRWGIAPSLAFGLGTDTRVNLDYYHLESNDTPDSGIPYTLSNPRTKSNPDKPYAGGDDSNFYGLDRDFRKGRTDTATFAIEHDLNDSLTLKNTLRHGTSMQDYILTQPDDSKGNVNNGSVWRRANTRVSNTETTTNQTDLFGTFYVAGFKNSFSTGVEYTREQSEKSSYNVNTDTTPRTSAVTTNCNPGLIGAASGYNCTSLSNPNPNDPWNGAISRNYAGTDTQADTYALYVFDTLELSEQWLVNMGLRYDHFDTDYKTYNAAGRTTSKGDDTSEFVTGQFGVVYKPAENGSIYASYATSATPPGNTLGEGQEGNPLGGTPDRSGNLLSSDMEPETTKNYEIGTKWDLLNDRLSLTADIFRTEKENARVQVDTSSYENAGKTRVQGFELSASGKLTDKWQVFAGYAFMDSEQVDGGPLGRANDGNDLPNTPKNSASLWTTYQVTPKLTIGGGAFYVDDVYGSVANTTMVDSYVRYDAMAAYKLTKNVDLQLNVQNLTDETYYDKAFSTHFANQAAGRTALLSTNFHF